jgi:hypothetical protein
MAAGGKKRKWQKAAKQKRAVQGARRVMVTPLDRCPADVFSAPLHARVIRAGIRVFIRS